MTMTNSTVYGSKIKSHIADAIQAADLSGIDFNDSDAAEQIISKIENTQVQLSLSFDSNCEMMSFIDEVRGEIDIDDSIIDFSKCSTYLDAMLVEFQAYMSELTHIVLNEYVETLVSTSIAVREATADLFGIVDEEELEISLSNQCLLDHIPHDSEHNIQIADNEVSFNVWKSKKTTVAQFNFIYIEVA